LFIWSAPAPAIPASSPWRGAELLSRANVVVYDALANPQLLKHCPQATAIYVGKRAAAHSMTQEQINAVLVEYGKKPGNRVVRLKGGDPFVFGRGGEECEALADAGIPFEVVPGITAAIAASAYAGIPVTHRDLNSSFTFLTGHEKEEEYRDGEAKARGKGGGSDVDWASIAKLPCIAFYMGVKSLPRICQNLIDHGMPPDMPAATIQWGTTPRQRTIVGTITTLPTLVAEAKLSPPALTDRRASGATARAHELVRTPAVVRPNRHRYANPATGERTIGSSHRPGRECAGGSHD